MPHTVFDIAFAAQHPQRDGMQGAVLAGQQQRTHTLCPHGLHFVRHAGHEHSTVAILFKPCTGGRAVVVDDLVAVHRHHGLLAVVWGRLAPGTSEEIHDLLPFFRVKSQRVAVASSNRLLGQVIRRGAKAAGEHQQVAPLLCLVDEIRQTAVVVANGALALDGDAQSRQLPAEVLGVGVENVAEQQLGAHTDDLCCHGFHPSNST